MAVRFPAMLIVVALAGVALGISGASAAAPTLQRLEIDQTVPDPDLTLICGFPVALHAEGHMILRSFDQDGAGVSEIDTYSLFVAIVANGKAYPLPAHGGNIIRITTNGDVISLTFGMTSGFTGVFIFNRTTGEAIVEPQRTFGVDLDDLCAALAA